MYRTRSFLAPLVGLIILGLLVMGGFALQRAAWWQGYMMGQLAAGGEAPGIAYMPYGPNLFGPFLVIGLLVLLVLVGGFIVRLLAWQGAARAWMKSGGPKAEEWARHWHRSHGGHHPFAPPWCWAPEETPEETDEAQATPEDVAGDKES
jgi:hypothetical protein